LASGSNVNRFHHAYTLRQAEVPLEERPVLREVDAAQSQGLQILKDYLVELFIRTRRSGPSTSFSSWAMGKRSSRSSGQAKRIVRIAFLREERSPFPGNLPISSIC
jgi:hypothetical protein